MPIFWNPAPEKPLSHLTEAVHLLHIRKQHGLHYHEAVVTLIPAMRLQVLLQIDLLNNLRE